jgi:predicted AlkP superfamily phosphohydrolase/phosphomutase
MTRTLIVGFDGATLDLLDRWRAEGRLPVVEALLQDGSHGPLASTFPYNSAVAWTSLATGMQPSRHGIFDFVLPAPGEYRLRVATRQDRRVPALWTHASEAGARVGVVNIPMTFPAERVNGVMVSGMDAPRLEERAVHPAGYLDALRRMAPGYRIMSKAALEATKGDWDAAERELLDALRERSRFVCELARPRDLDLLMVNFEATDGVHHFFWQHHDPAHPRHDPSAATRWGDAIGRVYRASDRELGRVIEAYAPDTVFLVSDHGGGPSSDWVFFLNDWLAAEGFLAVEERRSATVSQRLYATAKSRLSVPARRALRPLFGKALERARSSALYGGIDWSRSRAYGQMQPAVRLNLAGREPQGLVRREDREPELDRLAARAGAATLPTGEALFGKVARAEDLHVDDDERGFDLVLDLAPGTHIRSRNTSSRKGFLHHLRDLGTYLPSGVHTPTGLVAAAGTGIERQGRVEVSDIHQVAASVLAVMGVPAPELDGAPFGFVSARLQTTSGDGVRSDAPDADLDQDEEELILERLRGLGYVD